MKSNRELLIEAEFNMIENTTKLSSNVKKIIYDENLDIRKEERKKAKENMQAVIIDIKNMAEVNTLQHVFKNVYVIPCRDNNDVYSSQNNMVIATDDNLSFEHSFKLNIMENEIVITDEYCPIDTLITKV